MRSAYGAAVAAARSVAEAKLQAQRFASHQGVAYAV